MIWSTPAIQDATIYEMDPYRNTGLDPILELRKQGDTSTSDLKESRILIKFDISELSNILSVNNITINDVTASLKLHTVQESALPLSYKLQSRMLAEDWVNGSGYLTYPGGLIPSTGITDGATWVSTSGTGSLNWADTATVSAEYQFANTSGGGAWYTASMATQSFSFKTTDNVSINVTDAVKSWYNEDFENNGLLVSFEYNAITSSNYPTTTIQFYSSETTTVHEPKLYIEWAGTQTYSIGSQTAVAYEDSPVIYVRAFRGEYPVNSKNRILVAARDKYPRRSFGQNSDFSTIKALPSTTYYQIRDAHNDEIIIPFSTNTKVNSNTSGSYFDFYSTMMYAERYYKFEFKVEFNDITEYFSSSDYIFKITN